jgi:hypothetical protein
MLYGVMVFCAGIWFYVVAQLLVIAFDVLR